MLKYVKGSLFDGHDDIIIHQCNCFCNWGAGIARTMRSKYPAAWGADLLTTPGDKNKMGTYTYWTDNLISVINVYGQYTMGRTKTQTDYDALRSALRKVNKDFPSGTIGMPKVGCGLGGGNWNIVSKIIEEEFKDREVTIYEI